MKEHIDIHEKNLPILEALKDLGSEKYKEYKEKFLIKEAKRRGFEKGVKVRAEITGNSFKPQIISQFKNFEFYNNTLGVVGGSDTGCLLYIFKDGKWAEIIKPKEEIITFEDGRKAKVTFID